MTDQAKRPFLSVHFKCCNVYQRIFKTRKQDAYAGHCPKCLQSVRIPIGPEGTSDRFFSVQ